MDRLIQVKDIPSSLWSEPEKTLFLSKSLTDSWKKLLASEGLEDLAIEKSPEGFTGGMNKEDTDKHLAWRYTGSCGRVVMTCLDPKNHLSEVSDAYAKTFAGNRVLLVDIPCGSGAGAVSIITILIELRKHGVLPRLPLKLNIVAADISEYALGYCSTQLKQLVSLANEQAIEIEYETHHWDVTDKISTADLIERLNILNQGCDSRLLLLTNFTDFLEKENKWKLAEPQFEQLFIHSRGKFSTAIWIEPQKNNVANFFARLVGWFNTKLIKLFKSDDVKLSTDYAITDAECKHPLKNHKFKIGLSVKRLQLPVKD
ncbi:hypothetical protein MPL1_08017 [Methylophaga lonarensis MPL]|uniref:Uncharacterized protein n=1 Tax=Methylophaga lonarensis MPL TaxID=1286106 RepID=M7PR31_9GAMM|nr:hypothetical protein [Methylophaga lonarensis]EMR12899.1 hypothetical protein MPL1_08017 [Methylophaga lonarensis MPL]